MDTIMTVIKLTEDQFTTLVETALKDDSINLTSLTVLDSQEGTLIQSASGEYLLVRK